MRINRMQVVFSGGHSSDARQAGLERAVMRDAERRAAEGWPMDNIMGEPNAREQSKAISGMTITYLQMSARIDCARKEQNNVIISQKRGRQGQRQEARINSKSVHE
jgi:hypothetical protein